jgi:hypothetical protein
MEDLATIPQYSLEVEKMEPLNVSMHCQIQIKVSCTTPAPKQPPQSPWTHGVVIIITRGSKLLFFRRARFVVSLFASRRETHANVLVILRQSTSSVSSNISRADSVRRRRASRSQGDSCER